MDANSNSIIDSESVMFYNVENLFPADEKPVRRGLPSASGLRNWNSWRYGNKIQKIASVFRLVKEENGNLPFLIGISEVQGRAPLEELVTNEPFSSLYGIVHYESMDERGVDVALLYDKSKLKVIASEPNSFFFEVNNGNADHYDTTRDILFCKMKYESEVLNVFVFHLPSKREKDVNKPKRNFIMKEIRERIQRLIGEKDEAVILCGDFNENPDEENLCQLLVDENGKEILENPFRNLFESRSYSTFHLTDGLLFDQIIFSKHFLREDFPLRFQGAEVFKPQQISNWDRRFAGRPFRTFAGSRYLGGYSDHFPVIAKFVKN